MSTEPLQGLSVLAARAILALVDGDIPAALDAIEDAGDDIHEVRRLALALAQFRANVTTPDDAAELAKVALARQEDRP